MDESIRTLKQWIAESSNVVFFGGAGVSTVVFGSLFNYLQSGKAAGSLVGGTVLMVITFCLCYVALKLAAKAVRKRLDELNAEPDDTMDFGSDA